MPDDEGRRLIDAYGAAAHVYSIAVSRLQKDRGYLAIADYSVDYSEAEHARLRCESARAELNAFRESHPRPE